MNERKKKTRGTFSFLFSNPFHWKDEPKRKKKMMMRRRRKRRGTKEKETPPR